MLLKKLNLHIKKQYFVKSWTAVASPLIPNILQIQRERERERESQAS